MINRESEEAYKEFERLKGEHPQSNSEKNKSEQ